MRSKKIDKEYRAPMWLSVFILIACVALPIALAFLSEAKTSLLGVFLWAFSAMGIVALIELKISKVVIRNDTIVMVGLFKRTVLPMTSIDFVQLEDWQAHIKLKDGNWQKLPQWFSHHRSFFQTMKHRLKKESEPIDSTNGYGHRPR